jgi:hypothetical protein
VTATPDPCAAGRLQRVIARRELARSGAHQNSSGAVGSALGGWAFATGGWSFTSWIGLALPIAALTAFLTERRRMPRPVPAAPPPQHAASSNSATRTHGSRVADVCAVREMTVVSDNPLETIERLEGLAAWHRIRAEHS